MEKKRTMLALLVFCVFVFGGCTKPVADFEADVVSGFAPLTVLFSDLSTSETSKIDQWSWSFSSSAISSKQNPEYIFAEPGMYTISLTVSNELDLHDTITKKDYIEVFEKPKLDLISGLWFSPFKDGQDPRNGDVASESQVRERLSIIRHYTDHLIFYYNENSAKVASEFGLKVTLVVWIGDDYKENQRQIDWAVQLTQDGLVDVIAVGYEVLFRDNLPELELLDLFDQIRADVPANVQITYIDNHATLAQYPAVIDACDVIYVVIHPFWEEADIENAVDHLEEKYLVFKNEIGDVDKEIVVITGWPDAGDAMPGAEATLENLCKYYKEFSVWADKNEVKYFYTDALDEKYRQQYDGSQAGHWGLWDSKGELKSCLTSDEE